MRYKSLLPLFLLACCLCGGALTHAAASRRLTIDGSVRINPPTKQLPRFIARLYFPKDSGRQPLVTRVNESGQFSFTELYEGRFLLELYEGDQLVHQQVVTLPGDQRVSITLRSRGGD